MLIKLCGMRRPQDIGYANDAKPDFIGFILAEGYRRTISAEQAAELAASLQSEIKAVGVFIDQSPEFLAETAEKIGLYAVQLHGNEDADYISRLRMLTKAKIWKAARVQTAEDIHHADSLGADMLVLDSFSPDANGGTGKVADWELIKSVRTNTPYLLAGGIDINNIEQAIKILPPGCGIDISGGTETDGVKDPDKIKAIMNIVRKVDKDV
ncbi:MAG: phosphoribosylanthranilate isomerase [Oscillospiraceae bacterium]|nr:phosphoribosylanthranilate isomerase [Oscillospiraceae bacterium]